MFTKKTIKLIFIKLNFFYDPGAQLHSLNQIRIKT